MAASSAVTVHLYLIKLVKSKDIILLPVYCLYGRGSNAVSKLVFCRLFYATLKAKAY